jgi:Chalcone and stilbene synthases, C-terminal domain
VHAGSRAEIDEQGQHVGVRAGAAARLGEHVEDREGAAWPEGAADPAEQGGGGVWRQVVNDVEAQHHVVVGAEVRRGRVADCFRIVLTTELPAVVERGLADSVTGFLAEHDLTVDDIVSWICHPGGPKVIDAVQRALKLPDRAVAASRRSLAEVGNMSSASVLHILEMVSDTERPPAGSAGLMIGLGPGVSAELVLLRW